MDAAPVGIVAPMVVVSPIDGPLWFVQARSSWRRHLSSWYGPAACAPTAPCGAMAAAALTDIFLNSRQKPRSRGAFFLLNDQRQRLTSNDDASSGGASDGGDASPNVCDASGGASPSAGDAGPNAFDPSRDDGRGPSALLPA